MIGIRMKIGFIFLCIIPVILSGQGNEADHSHEFGHITAEDLSLNSCSFEPGAEALVLFDVGKTYFVESKNSFDVVYERITRIKIFSKTGDKWGEVRIPVYHEKDQVERLYDLEAYTYNVVDGQVNKIPFNKDHIFEEKLNQYWKVKKFVLSDVKEGSIIEYTYKISSPYLFNLREWNFQWTVPVLYSEYQINMIPYYEYSWLMQGAKKFDVYKLYQDKGVPRSYSFSGPSLYGDNTYYDMISVFGMKNIPSFKDEVYITSVKDYIRKIYFQLSKIHFPDGTSKDIVTTWDALVKDLLETPELGKFEKKSEKLVSNLLDMSLLDKMTEDEKFDYILNYVKHNYKWNGDDDRFATKTVNQLVTEKSGNSADLNLFTIGLLNGAGIEAYPVLTSTREHGRIKYDYPYGQFFDYVLILAKLHDRDELTDATEEFSLNNRIPTKCINDKGLIIKKGDVQWVGLNCMFTSSVLTEMDISFASNLRGQAQIVKTATEYDATDFRDDYESHVELNKKNLLQVGWTLNDTSIVIRNQEEKKLPYIVEYKASGMPEFFDNKMMIEPFLTEAYNDNPLKQESRTFPLDMIYAKKRTYKSSITIPAGYQVESMPTEEKISNDLFELTYTIITEPTNISLAFEYSFKKPVYAAEDYSKIKSYFDKIAIKGKEKLIFAKTTTKETKN